MLSNQALNNRLFDKISLVLLTSVERVFEAKIYLVLARNNKTENLKTPREQKSH